MKKFAIARPGYPFVFVSAALGLASLVFYPALSLVFFVLSLFFAFFFRDPPRRIPGEDESVISPADGRIMKVEKTHEPHFLGEEVWKISIFLSVFDVHVNRSPYEGSVIYRRYIPGNFKAAFREDASTHNERNLIGLQTKHGRMLVVQIAGLLARRIVCWIETGDQVEQGARIGMIRFGSCTEIYMPLSVIIKVKEGERVRGGESILGEIQTR